MINNGKNLSLNYLLTESNTFNNYPSIINKNASNLYYLNMINNKTLPNFYIDDDDKINMNEKMSNINYSQEKNINYQNNHHKYIFFNKNISKNHIKNFSYWNNILSDLSLNKYRLMLTKTEKNNLNKTKKSQDFYKENNITINYTNPKTTKNYRKIKQNVREYSESENDRKTLNKEIHNYNLLEKKINKTIERSNIEKRLKFNTNDLDIDNDDIFNYKIKINESEKEKNNLNKNRILNNKNNQGNKYKKINNYSEEQSIKKNLDYNNNNNNYQKNVNLNQNFIKYLKKDNQKLLSINNIYKQLLDSFFYFINQLSIKYFFGKEIKDINYYISNRQHLSNILIDLEEHLNKLIKEKKEDNDKELMSSSKFITINIDKNKNNKEKKIKRTKTRNNFSLRELLSQNLQNNKKISDNNNNKNIVITTQKNFSKEKKINDEVRKTNEAIQNNRQIKIKLTKHINNGKIIKIMNKLNLEFLNKKQTNSDNKLIFKRNLIINNNIKNKNSTLNESNDLKSLINPKFNIN